MVSSKQTISEVSHADVLQFNSLAKKDKVNLKDTATPTQWFGIFINNDLVGCAGIVIKGSKGRIRGVFILPEYRGQGLGASLMSYIIKVMTDKHVNYIDQLSSQPDWWVKNGWTKKGKALNGYWIYKVF